MRSRAVEPLLSDRLERVLVLRARARSTFALLILMAAFCMPAFCALGEAGQRASRENSSRSQNAGDRLRAYGYVGDGSGKTLASRFASLEAARLVYPHAIRFDRHPRLGRLTGHHQRQFPPPTEFKSTCRQVLASSTNPSSAEPPRSKSTAGDATRRVFLLEHQARIFSSTVLPKLFITRILYCATSGFTQPLQAPRYAINIRQNRDSGGFVLEDVIIAAYSAKFSWVGYVNGVGTSNTNWRDVIMTGGEYNPVDARAGMTEVGVTFTSNKNEDRSVVYNLDNVQVGAVPPRRSNSSSGARRPKITDR